MKSFLRQPWLRALAIAAALFAALAITPAITHAQSSCDPTRQSCVCSATQRALGQSRA